MSVFRIAVNKGVRWCVSEQRIFKLNLTVPAPSRNVFSSKVRIFECCINELSFITKLCENNLL